jgi:type VI secretion system secreted protein Hcp
VAIDIFLKVDGIDGESKDSVHTNEIDILSWNWGESNPGSFGQNSGGGTGKVAMQDVTFSIAVCKASPALMKACATGQPVNSAVLTNRKAGTSQQEFLVITLTNCVVSSYQAGTSNGADSPIDSFSLNYGQIQVQYNIQQDDGSVVAAPAFGWSLETNAVV